MLRCVYISLSLLVLALVEARLLQPRISDAERDPAIQNYSSFMISLRTRMPRKYFGDNHFCAGSIIGPSVVLTAAHCVMDKRKVMTRPRRLLVIAGTPNRLDHTNYTQVLPVDSVKPHPNYTLYNTNDVALIIVGGVFETSNPRINIMPLPTDPPPYKTMCYVLGWGRIFFNGPLAAEVLHVKLLLYTDKECLKRNKNFAEGMLCAGDDILYNKDPCRGDSGGPLICDDVLTGIISWTIGCGNNLYPSLYTEVYLHIAWIEETLKGGAQENVRPMFCFAIIMFLFPLLTSDVRNLEL